MKENPKLRGADWLNIDNMLRELAPDLWQRSKEEMESDAEDPTIYDEIFRLKGFAIYMVRYASSPKTKRAFTFSDLSVKREDCIGTTAGIWGREEQIARITVELYQKLHNTGPSPN